MKRWEAAVGGLILVGILAGCSAGAPKASSQAETVNVEASAMAFSVKEIKVKKGTPVTLVLNNKADVLHDFSIDKLPATVGEAHGASHEGHGSQAGTTAVHVAADPGKSGSVQFTPTEPGIYTYYCTVEGHKDSGMVGKLIVE